jgi:hypothetical protein
MFKISYYWIYYYLSQFKRSVPPAFDAFLLVILIQAVNIIAIGRIIYHFTQFKITKNTATYIGIALVILLFAGNYAYLFIRKNKIFTTIGQYTEKRLRISKVLFWIYAILSFLIIGLVINYM